MIIILASNNQHKVDEIAHILQPYLSDQITIHPLHQYPQIPDPPEEQPTFAGNALQKARFVYQYTGGIVVADDSGIEVDALHGEPGVYSKRYTPEQTAEANNQKLLHALQNISTRSARFRCAMAVVAAQGELVVEGRCEGSIARHLRGKHGFGYDPLFIPDDFPAKSMAELTASEKNSISHRGKAFSQLPVVLRSLGLLPKIT